MVEHEIAYLHPSLENIWVLNNIFMRESSQTFLMASQDRVFIYGANTQTGSSQVIGYDLSNGRELWAKKFDAMSLLYQSGYLIVGGVGDIYSLNPENGKTLWSKYLPPGKAISVYLIRDTLYARVFNRIYAISPQTGEFLNDGFTPPQRSTEDWAYYFDRAVVVDKQTKQITWDTERDVISNLTFDGANAYAVTEAGLLLQLTLNTEKINTLVEFEPNPFHTRTEENGLLSYYVYSNSDYLFVYLGDSSQLFAFKILR